MVLRFCASVSYSGSNALFADLAEVITESTQVDAVQMFNTLTDLDLACDVILALPQYAREWCFVRATLPGLRPAVLDRLSDDAALHLYRLIARPKRKECATECKVPGRKVRFFGLMAQTAGHCLPWKKAATSSPKSPSPPKSPSRPGSARHPPKTPHQNVQEVRQSLQKRTAGPATGPADQQASPTNRERSKPAGDPLFDRLEGGLFGRSPSPHPQDDDPLFGDPLFGRLQRGLFGDPTGPSTPPARSEDVEMATAPEQPPHSLNQHSPAPPALRSPAPIVQSRGSPSGVRSRSSTPPRKVTVEDASGKADPPASPAPSQEQPKSPAASPAKSRSPSVTVEEVPDEDDPTRPVQPTSKAAGRSSKSPAPEPKPKAPAPQPQAKAAPAKRSASKVRSTEDETLSDSDDEDPWEDEDDYMDEEERLKAMWSWMKEDPRSDAELAALLPLEPMDEYLEGERSWRATNRQPYRPFSWRHASDKAKSCRQGPSRMWAYASEWQWAMRIRSECFLGVHAAVAHVFLQSSVSRIS